MSLIEVMLHNKLIILSVGVSGLLLALAVIITIAVRIRTMLRQRRSKHALAAPAPAVGAEIVPAAAAALSTAEQHAAPTTTGPAAAKPAVTTTPAATTEATEPSSALKSLVANAFVDDELIARRNALIHGLENIDVKELNKLAEKVRETLRARSGAAA